MGQLERLMKVGMTRAEAEEVIAADRKIDKGEKMDFDLAAEITDMLDIPTIGIGSGQRCDGQVLVIHDILGLFDKFVPPFVKQYANLREEIVKAAKAYIDDVKSNVFPEK